MTVRLRAVGNSMTVTIPKIIVNELNLSQGMEVSVETTNDAIMVKPVKQPEKVTIKSLFAGYNGGYKPTEVDWGEERGNEIW